MRLGSCRHLYLSVPVGWGPEGWAQALAGEARLQRGKGGAPDPRRLRSILVGGEDPGALGERLAPAVRAILSELAGADGGEDGGEAPGEWGWGPGEGRGRGATPGTPARRAGPPAMEWTVEVEHPAVLARSLTGWLSGGVTRVALRGAAATPRQVEALREAHGGGLGIGVEVLLPEGQDPSATAREVAMLVEAGADALSWVESEAEDAAAPWMAAVLQARALGWETPDLATAHRPGRRPRHRAAILRREPTLGLGPGAVSFREPGRRWNLESPTACMKALGSGRLPLAGEEVLTPGERCLERCWSGLRTERGVRLPHPGSRSLRTLPLHALLSGWEGDGLARLEPGSGWMRVRPTLAGWRRADAMAVALSAVLEEA